MTLVLVSPLAGWAVPIDAVADPVFAGRMLGDGVAIDPTGDTLHAPCDGRVLSVHAARHAVTLASTAGAEVLIHLGLDTVALGGAGITALVAAGDTVRAGDPLLSFDLDALVRTARAVVTPVLVMGDGWRVTPLAHGTVAVGDPIARAEGGTISDAVERGAVSIERRVTVSLDHGVHARPAARIVAAVKNYSAQVTLVHGDRTASAMSAVALLGLGIARGAAVDISADGPDAVAALDAVAGVLADATPEEAVAPRLRGDGPGVPASSGIAAGRAHRLVERRYVIPDGAGPADGPALKTAIAAVGADLRVGGSVMAAQAALLDDPTIGADLRAAVAGGASAARAVDNVLNAAAAQLGANPDARIAERAADLKDIADRLLEHLLGPIEAAPVPPGAILIARDLLPSDVAALDPARVAGIALSEGGPTSHAAILAAGKGLPMAVAFGPALDSVADGTMLVLDATRGRIETDPGPERLAEVAAGRARAGARPAGPCRTADGTHIELFANLGSMADAEAAMEAGAEGCGLLRTEFLFLDRATPPTEGEQVAEYRRIADVLGDRPLVVRLLDIGGDKPALFLSIPSEENPALGLRGIRVGLKHRDLLATQLAAIRAVPGARILVPMVTGIAELDEVAALIGDDAVPMGAMIETPAAAMTARTLARRATFLSIGTNDLTQYALAMDRGNAAVAAQVDALHPGVLRLIAATCDGAGDVPVAVCGGLAADPLGAAILIGLGVTELSVPPAQLGAIRAVVGATTLADARALAVRALDCASAADVRGLMA